MNNVRIKFEISVNENVFKYEISDVFENNELISMDRPQLAIQKAITQIEKYLNNRKFKKEMINIDSAITDLISTPVQGIDSNGNLCSLNSPISSQKGLAG